VTKKEVKMSQSPIGIKLEVSTVKLDGFPDWQQGLPQRTPAEVAAYGLGFLKGIVNLGPGLFLQERYQTQFLTMLDSAIQLFESSNIPDGLTQVETVILSKITEWVLPENRVPFRQVVDFAIHGVRFSGEYYFDPPLDEILQNGGIEECTKIKISYHIEGVTLPGWKWLNCLTVGGSVHVEKIIPPE